MEPIDVVKSDNEPTNSGLGFDAPDLAKWQEQLNKLVTIKEQANDMLVLLIKYIKTLPIADMVNWSEKKASLTTTLLTVLTYLGIATSGKVHRWKAIAESEEKMSEFVVRVLSTCGILELYCTDEKPESAYKALRYLLDKQNKAASVPEKTSKERTKTELKSDLVAAINQNDEYERKLSEVSTEKAELVAQVTDATATLQCAQEEIDSLRIEVERLTIENRRLEALLAVKATRRKAA